MSRITHPYGLYNPLLWVVRPTIMGYKLHPCKNRKSKDTKPVFKPKNHKNTSSETLSFRGRLMLSIKGFAKSNKKFLIKQEIVLF